MLLSIRSVTNISAALYRTDSQLIYFPLLRSSTWWRTWLSHCAISLKDAGSIPDGVIGIFHRHNPSGRTIALGLTTTLTEMSTRIISWGQRRPLRRADNVTTFLCRMSCNLGALNCWYPRGLSRPVIGLLYLCCVFVRLILTIC
jgi:hypothetical protein